MDRICKKCGAVLDEDALFCTVCGTKYTQEPAKRFCGHCGNELGEKDAFCKKCGTPATKGAAQQAPPPRPLTQDKPADTNAEKAAEIARQAEEMEQQALQQTGNVQSYGQQPQQPAAPTAQPVQQTQSPQSGQASSFGSSTQVNTPTQGQAGNVPSHSQQPQQQSGSIPSYGQQPPQPAAPTAQPVQQVQKPQSGQVSSFGSSTQVNTPTQGQSGGIPSYGQQPQQPAAPAAQPVQQVQKPQSGQVSTPTQGQAGNVPSYSQQPQQQAQGTVQSFGTTPGVNTSAQQPTQSQYPYNMPQYTGNYQPPGSGAQGQQSAAYSGGYGNNYQQNYTQQGNAPYGQPQNSYNSGYAPAPAQTATKKRNGTGLIIALVAAALVLILGVFIISRFVGKNPARDAFDKLCDMTSLGSQSYLYARVLTEELLETDLATADPDEVDALFRECLSAWKAAETVSDRMCTMSEELSEDKGLGKIKGGSDAKKGFSLFGAAVSAEGEEQSQLISQTMTATESVARVSYLGTQLRTDAQRGYQSVQTLQGIYNGRSTSVTSWQSAVESTSSAFATQVYISGEITSGRTTMITHRAHSVRTLSSTVKAGSLSVGGTDILVDVGSTHSAIVYGTGEGVTMNSGDFADYHPDEDSSSISMCTYPEEPDDIGMTFHSTSFFSWFILDRAGGFTITCGNKGTDNPTTPPGTEGISVPAEGRSESDLIDEIGNNGGWYSPPARGPIGDFTPPIGADDIDRTFSNIEGGGDNGGGGDDPHDISLNSFNEALGQVGAGVGDITVSMIWDSHDDLDLHIINPDESHIYYSNKTAGGGTLDVDANASSSNYMEPPIENIYYPTPASGHYKVYIRDYRDRTDSRSTHYKVKVIINGEERLFEGDIDTTGTEIVIVEFDYVGAQSGTESTSTPPTSESLTDLLNAAGAGSGDITVSMAWDRWDDLDLHMETPDGSHIYYSNKTAGGGILDVDMNAGSERRLDPVENIYFAAPENGHYKVWIRDFNDRSDDSASYLVRVTIGGQSQEFRGTIDGTGTDIDIIEFDYGGASNGDEGTFGGHRYRYFESDMSWTQARSYCQSLEGHLVTITSAEEQSFITGRWPEKNGWIGAYGDSSGYSWVTGEAWGYTNWASNQPDNANGDEWFVHLWNGGTWNDLNNDDSTYHYHHGFFCEWDSQSDLNESVMDEALTQQSAQSGEITISLLWDSEDDLDLHVFTPDGSEIYYGNKEAGGGVLDVDANAFSSSLMPNPVENVYFESPEDGEYWVYVINYHDRTDGSATNYLVRLQVGDEVQTFSGTLTNEDESAEIVGFRYTAD